MNDLELNEYLRCNKEFCMIDFQEHFSLTYSQVCKVLDEMQSNQVIDFCGGLNFVVKNLSNLQDQSDRSKTPSDDQTKQESPMEIEIRRRELMERLARMSAEDDDDDDDEDDDDDVDLYDPDEEDDEECTPEEDCERLKKYSSQANDCKLLNGISYVKEKLKAQKIVNILGGAGYELTLKSIQYGTASTGYVFNYPSQKKDIADLDKYVGHIKYILHTEKVTVVAPWGDATVYVLVKHDAELDPFSKKVLQFWITRNGGRASIASVQRGLGIGFNRAGRILEQLQELGCVEPLSPNNDAPNPLRVQINLQEINILFPQYLGWE